VVAVPRVTDVHDLHVWQIAGGMTALSAHVQVEDDCALSACDDLLAQVNGLLAGRYKIGHSTLQFEYACCERHDPDNLYCGMAGEEGDHDHSTGGMHAVSSGGNRR
jgi:hypothetical protein